MELEGLDYNTTREKLKLMAYGRDIQQMVDICVALPTKEERMACAQSIVDTMRRVVPSQQSYKERNPVLWYHLALMSDFKLDIDYPFEIVHEDKMSTPPDAVPYNKGRMPVRHYGRLLDGIFKKLKEMPDDDERAALAEETAHQMYRCLAAWGMNAPDKKKVAADLARYTDGVIRIAPENLRFDAPMNAGDMHVIVKKKKKRKK